MRLKYFLFALCAAFLMPLAAKGQAQEVKGLKRYIPNVHAAVRARWENDFDLGKSRFQLKNARILVDGQIAPTIDYFLQADLCDCGTMKFLDAWARVEIFKGFRIQGGQFRMPFGVEPFRAPGNYIFSNRSFLGKYMCNVRAVGAKVMYDFERVPLTVEGGVFNPTSIFDQTGWNSSYAYAGRLVYRPGAWRFETGIMSIKPQVVRINLLDFAAGMYTDRYDLAAEYMYGHYTHGSHRPTHGYAVWGDYKMPVKVGVFNRLSFQGRLDGMTDHCVGKTVAGEEVPAGMLLTDNSRRNRVTVGTTLSYISGRLGLDIRADYEKYFYRSGAEVPAGQGDKLVVELVLRF